MARQDILIIGLEYNSLRILEVSLRKAGFMVASVMSYSDAIEQIKIAAPDLVIIDSVKDSEAFEFAAGLKDQFKNLPVILISSNKEINTRIRALEIGIDDYLIKPIYIKEIIARIKIHLQKKEQQRVEEGITAGFIGSLSDIGLYDIIQTIELNKKSGILEIKGKVQDGRIFFKNGQIVQANVGRLRGEPAVYRMLTFNEGIFKMSFLDIDVESEIIRPNSAIIMEGMRRLDEYMKFTEQLPPLTTRLEVDSNILRERLKDIPDNVNKVLKLIDRERSINDIVEMSELDELETLKIISALYFDGIIYDIFAKRAEGESRIISTLPDPVVGAAAKVEEAISEEPKKSPAPELWAENVFVKEEKRNQEIIQKSDVGEYTIADSVKAESPKVERGEGAPEENKTELGPSPQKKDLREVVLERNSGLKEREAHPESQPMQKGVVGNVISPDKTELSPKEQLIENTLIENVTLSTSSYVKGSLLGRKDRERKKELKGRGIYKFIFIFVAIGLMAGGYFGYKFYYLQRGLRVSLQPQTERRMEVKDRVEKKEVAGLVENLVEKGASENKEIEEKREVKVGVKEEKMESNKIDGAEKDLSGEKREEITGKVQKETTPIEKKVTKRESEPEIDMERYSNLLKSAQGFYKSGNLKEAREELKQALIKNPKGYEAFTLLGQMELEANKVKSAITYLKRAISYNSGYAPAYFYLGTCYQLDGKNIEAKKMYQRYLNLAPDGEFANDVRAIMSDLK